MSIATVQVSIAASHRRSFGRRIIADEAAQSDISTPKVHVRSVHAAVTSSPDVHGPIRPLAKSDLARTEEQAARTKDMMPDRSLPPLSNAIAAFLNRAGKALDGMVASLKAQVAREEENACETIARCWENLPASAPFEAAARRLASARARLLAGEAQAVIDMLDAATEDKRLLGMAARAVLKWLREEGRAHDSPQFRMFLMRTLRLSEEALAERNRPPKAETFRQDALPADGIIRDIEKCLQAWRNDIREAWLIARRCQHLPEWQHWDVIVEVRPRALMGAADVPARVEELRQEMRRALEGIWLENGSLGIHLHPVQVQHGLLSQARDQGQAIFGASLRPVRNNSRNMTKSEAQHADDSSFMDGDRPELTPNASAVELPSRVRRKGFRLRRRIMLGMMAFGCLALSVSTYRLFYANTDTAWKIAMLEKQQAEEIGRTRIWRIEAGADARDPARTLKAYRLAMQARDRSPLLPIYTEESRKVFRGRFPSLVAMEHEWSTLTACGQPRIFMSADHVIAVYPNVSPTQDDICIPRFLRRENGRWRIDRVSTERIAPLFVHYVGSIQEALRTMSRKDPQGRPFTLKKVHLPLELVPRAYLAAYRARRLAHTPAP